MEGKGFSKDDGIGTLGDPQKYALRAAYDTVEAAQRRQGMLKGTIKKEQSTQAGVDTAAATTKDDFEEAKKQYGEAKKEIHDLGQELQKLT